MQKLSWKEKYAGILILIIGIIGLLLQIVSKASNTSSSYSLNPEALVVNKNELFSDIRTWILIVTAIAAGYLLLKSKTLGWVLGVPVLLLFTALLMLLVIQTKKIDASSAIPGIGLSLMIIAIVFLLAKTARKHYRVSNLLVMLTLLLFIGMGAMVWFLQ